MFPEVSAPSLSLKSPFTFSPVHVPCGYTWEESEQGVPGRSLQCYASRLRFHLYQRHRGRAFTQPLSSIFLGPFPWKPHTVVAAAQNTPQNRGSHFLLLVPHLGSTSSWGSRESCNERMRAVFTQGQTEMLNSWKNNSPRGDVTRGGHQSAWVCVHGIRKTHILYSKVPQSLEQHAKKASIRPAYQAELKAKLKRNTRQVAMLLHRETDKVKFSQQCASSLSVCGQPATPWLLPVSHRN